MVGQSCLALLADYGNMSNLTRGKVPMPSIVEIPMDEVGRDESFKWMKKMVIL